LVAIAFLFFWTPWPIYRVANPSSVIDLQPWPALGLALVGFLAVFLDTMLARGQAWARTALVVLGSLGAFALISWWVVVNGLSVGPVTLWFHLWIWAPIGAIATAILLSYQPAKTRRFFEASRPPARWGKAESQRIARERLAEAGHAERADHRPRDHSAVLRQNRNLVDLLG